MKRLVSTGIGVLRDQGILTTAKMTRNFATVRARQNYNRRFNKIEKKSVYDEDWDLLIILDACRYDLMKEVYNDYDFLKKPKQYISPGSHSKEWMMNSFTEDYKNEMMNTVHITANPFSDEVLDKSEFEVLDEMWKHSWDSEIGTVHPDSVTDKAIALGRETNSERYIVHYMQPHFPSINYDLIDLSGGDDPSDSWGEEVFENPWRKLEMGLLSEQEVWSAYRNNLEVVLNSVQTLMRNFDSSNAVVTADHGNAKGEKGVFGHPEYLNLDCLRNVPWIETEATDNEEYYPEEHRVLSNDEKGDLEDKLNDLGYS